MKASQLIYALGAFMSSLSICCLCYVSIQNIESKEFPHVWVGTLMIFFGIVLIVCFVAHNGKTQTRCAEQ
jgi:hypothetical protein